MLAFNIYGCSRKREQPSKLNKTLYITIPNNKPKTILINTAHLYSSLSLWDFFYLRGGVAKCFACIMGGYVLNFCPLVLYVWDYCYLLLMPYNSLIWLALYVLLVTSSDWLGLVCLLGWDCVVIALCWGEVLGLFYY